MLQATDPQGYAACCAAIRDADFRETVRKIAAPTLVFTGAHDPVTTPADGRFLASNIHGAKYVSQLKTFRARNASVVKTIADLIARGVAALQFRSDVDPEDLHLFISSLCFHRVANRHTFTAAFGRDPSGARSRARHRQMIVDAVMRFMQR